MFTTTSNQFGIEVEALVAPKAFSTGSVGWFMNDKIVVDGIRYSAQAQAVVVNSKGIVKDGDDEQAVLKALGVTGNQTVKMQLVAKDFKTGSKGWFNSGKMAINGHICQVQVQLAAIGTSDKAIAKAGERADKAAAAAETAAAKAAEKRAQLLALKASIGA